MDKSEKYIKMCEKSTEVQGLHNKPYEITDIVTYPARNYCKDALLAIGIALNETYIPPIPISDDALIVFGTEGLIWIPRQDQLQDMVTWDFVGFSSINNGGMLRMEIYKDREQTYHIEGFSMEQLWLAFVMHEKFGKIWDGENWLKR